MGSAHARSRERVTASSTRRGSAAFAPVTVAIFGLHVHVGMPSPAAAIAVADGLRTHVPELLALSANSPFWQGRDTGLASTRSKIFECSADLDEVARICERGEGASEQRRTQDEAGSLLAVAQWLARTTVADLN